LRVFARRGAGVALNQVDQGDMVLGGYRLAQKVLVEDGPEKERRARLVAADPRDSDLLGLAHVGSSTG